jgi:hypothetical protein
VEDTYVDPKDKTGNTYTTATTKVSGTGSVADFGSTLSYKSMWLNGADITLNDSTKKLLITATNKDSGGLSVSKGSAWYDVVCQGSNKITVKDGGSISLSASNGLTIYDSDGTSTLDLTIDSTAGDVSIRKVYINSGSMLTVNLHKVNALGVGSQIGSAYGGKHLTVNMDCDQNVSLDFRNNTINAFNITNGATLTVSGWGYVASGASTSNLILADELKNGSIFFSDKCSDWNVESWDAENSAFTVKRNTNTMTIYFVDENEEQLKDLSFTAVDGGWLITGMQAVPEPAEWAMIFGGIALGLAIYRRRK